MKPSATGSRLAAGVLLAFQALWWAGSAAILVVGSLGLSPTAELLAMIPVVLMFMTFLAIFLLIQAPRAGIWLGLSLQVIVVFYGFVLLVAFEQLIGAVEVALGVITALCLAVAANEILRRRE